MNNTLLVAVMAALGCGTAIGIQTTITTLIGRSAGPVRAGLLVNIGGGLLALLIVIGLAASGRLGQFQLTSSGRMALAAGALGVMILSGIAFSFPRTGLAAGMGAVFLGQMAIAVIVDTLGRAGGEPIPLDPRRIVGLAVMAVAVFLLLPRN